MRNTKKKFWKKVYRYNDCLVWTGLTNEFGYGRWTYRGKGWKTHRLVWYWKYGPIPKGLFVCHTCDNPPCVRIEHLFLGTHQDNIDDAVRKGRASGGMNGGGVRKIDFRMALRIAAIYETGKFSHRDLAVVLGVAHGTIRNAIIYSRHV